MSISDPALLLQRVPELEALVEDARIRRAIESGDPFKVYRALVLARLFRRLPQHRELLKSLTDERRLFVKPLKGTPSLFSLNSFGFGFVGKSEQNADGSYIALHAVVALFILPLIPLGAFVVRETGSRQYQIYARAPLGIAGWMYTRGVAATLVVSVLVGAAHSFSASGSQDVIVLNGFAVPLTVDVGAQQVIVPPGGRSTLNLKVGAVTGTARSAKGAVLDTLPMDIRSSGLLSIWNIAGAAPLTRNTIVYSKTPGGGQNAQQVYCGTRFIEMANVRYAFQPAPETMSVSKHSDSTSVEQVEVAPTGKTEGAMACLSYGLNMGHEKDIARLAEAMAELNGWKMQLAGAAIFAANQVSAAEGLRVARRAVKAQPGDVRIARILQMLRERAGQHEDMLLEYAARARAEPDSVVAQYLYASLLGGQAGLEAMQALSERFPQDGAILRGLVWRKAARGNYDGALRDLARLHRVSGEDADLVADIEVRALMATHRGTDALALLERAMSNPHFPDRDQSAVEFALLARQLRADPERFLKPGNGNGSPLMLDLQRARAGLPLLQADSGADPQVKLALALRDAPAAAISQLGALPPGQLTGMSTSQRALLFGEAVRQGKAGVSAKLGELMHLSQTDESRLRQFVAGEAVTIDTLDLDMDMQAAMYFIRSRNPQLPAGERSALRQRAANLDVLHGAVSTALKQWPTESSI